MKSARRIASIALACMISASAWAADDDAAVVLLRNECGSLENCFESMSDLTTTGTTGWIWEVRQPSAGAPLLVDIGPGEFSSFQCGDGAQNLGYVTLRGSGREQTILTGAAGSNPGIAIDVNSCTNLSFMDLGARAHYGVQWLGTGSSSWSNVDLVGVGASYYILGWYDAGCSSAGRGVHYFHGSRIRAAPDGNVSGAASAFYSTCSENWIFGGEIFVDVQGPGGFAPPRAIWINGGFVEAFGTAIRGRGRGSANRDVVGVSISNTSTHGFPVAFHSHGVNIGLSTNAASLTNLNVIAIEASNNVTVHSAGTAYALTPGSTGTATRIQVIGGAPKPKIEAPFHWPAAANPPAVTSKNGEDIFVETDCTATSCTGTGGNQPHLMIYAPTACGTTNPWWDVSMNACRL